MIRYVVKRIIMLIPIILGITFMVYGLMSLAPGDPASSILGSNASQEEIEALNHKLGFDQPFIKKYFKFVYDMVFRLDFGNSYRTQQPIIDQIKERLPISFKLAFYSLLVATLVGVPIGVLAAVKQYTVSDTLASLFALFLASVPSFWLGMMLIFYLSFKIPIFPTFGLDAGVKSYVLPVITMSCVYAARMVRFTRSSMLETIRADYVRTARAKGATEKSVIWKHAMKNGLLPVVTLIGSSFGAQIGGAIVTENLFNLPGLGTLTLTSISTRDTPTVVATSVVFAIIYNVILIAVDIIYAFIDPRVKAKYSK